MLQLNCYDNKFQLSENKLLALLKAISEADNIELVFHTEFVVKL